MVRKWFVEIFRADAWHTIVCPYNDIMYEWVKGFANGKSLQDDV